SERDRTAAEISAAYEQNLGEMNQMFQQAAERYKEVSAELRAMTGEIHHELEATRQELRRGAVELPRETGEQAAAMRRVVADQIKALGELTALVVGSGRAHDISEPVPSEPVSSSRTEAAPKRAEPAAPPIRETRPEPAPARETRPESAIAPRREMPRESRFEPRPLPPRAPASVERGGGWMSDLLARA